MSKKQDAFYYDNFIACAELAGQAAHFLKEKLTDFDPAQMEENMEAIHRIEHAADEKKHQLTDVLAKAFITPIEREDIVSLSFNIDELADKAEEVFIRIYMNNVQTIRPDALDMLDIVIRCTEEESCMRASSGSTPWRSRRTRSIWPACAPSTRSATTCGRSWRGGRSTRTWRNARTPASTWRTWWKRSS